MSQAVAICGTGADAGTSAIGSSAWTNPTNIQANDANNATSSGAQWTNWLRGTNFGFSIPAGNIITDVKFDVDIKSYTQSGGSASGWNAQLYDSGLIGSQQGNTFGTLLNTLLTIVSGGLWGATLTPSIVNGSGFGVQLYVDAFSPNTITACPLNYFSLTITYIAGGMVFTQRRSAAVRRAAYW
jgi:hypothetical protein